MRKFLLKHLSKFNALYVLLFFIMFIITFILCCIINTFMNNDASLSTVSAPILMELVMIAILIKTISNDRK